MNPIKATWTNGKIMPADPVDWPEGSELIVEPVAMPGKIGLDESEWRDDAEALADWEAKMPTIETTSLSDAELIIDFIPDFTHDPVIRLLLSGEATTLHEAEEKYLDSAIPEILDLLRGPLSDEELARHPLLQMIRAHGSRGWEDSIL